MLAYGEWKFERDHAEAPIPKDITITGRFASATERLAVHNQKPGMSYSWQPPDKIRQMSYEGYKVSTDADLDTFGKSPSGVHRIGIQGNDEMILMEVPTEIRDQRQRAIGEKSRQRAEAVEKQGEAAIIKDKGQVYRPKESSLADNVNRKFS